MEQGEALANPNDSDKGIDPGVEAAMPAWWQAYTAVANTAYTAVSNTGAYADVEIGALLFILVSNIA